MRSASTGRRGAPKRTRLPAAERRESILRAATEVFARAGYRAGKISDVAARVGVTEPVIFQNFGSKAALFAAVVERAAAEVRSSLDEVTTAFGAPSALLAHILSGSPRAAATEAAAWQAGAGHPGPQGAQVASGAAYGVLFADAAALTDEPELTGPGRRALSTVAGHLADVIRRVQAEGGARREVDPDAAAWLVLSVLAAARLRAAAMPAALEPDVTALALGAITASGPDQGSTDG